MTTFNITAITTTTIAALQAGDSFESHMLKLQGLLKGAARDVVKDIIAPIVAKHYGETFADGKWADPACAAKRKANRIIANIVGSAPAKESNKVAVNKKLVAALADMLIDAGVTKAEFAATLAAVKAAVSFE
jgi:hypothetical protein